MAIFKEITIEQLAKDLLNNPTITPMPGKTKHETAWELAGRKYKQFKNNELALNLANDPSVNNSIEKQLLNLTKEDIKTIVDTIAKQVQNPWAVGASVTKKKYGVDASFKEGSPGKELRDKVAEGIKEKK